MLTTFPHTACARRIVRRHHRGTRPRALGNVDRLPLRRLTTQMTATVFMFGAASKELHFPSLFRRFAGNGSGIEGTSRRTGEIFWRERAADDSESEKPQKILCAQKLSHPFVVRTCMQDAMGRSKMERFYGFVEVDHHDLGEELVANGLARLHGTETRPPGMNSVGSGMAETRTARAHSETAKSGSLGSERGSFERARGKQRTILRRFVRCFLSSGTFARDADANSLFGESAAEFPIAFERYRSYEEA